MCLILIWSNLFLTTTVQAAEPMMQRQALVQIANEGLYYFLYQAMMTPNFKSGLTPDERKMFAGLEQVLEQVAALRWFEANKIAYFENARTPKIYTFAYADLAGDVVRFDSNDLRSPSLVFSNDRERFKGLKPGESERDAKTFPEFAKAIEINLFRLNNPATKFELGDAVAILVHEYGHKLGALEDQKAMNSLGVKLGEFIQSKVTTYELKSGQKMYSLFFKNFEFEKWLDYGFFRGMYDFKNGIPRSEGPLLPKNRMPVFSGQGVYLWSEFNGEFTNLTKDFLKKVGRPTSIKRDFENEKFYRFIDQTIYNLDNIQVIESIDPTAPPKIKFFMGQIGVQQPFMIPNVSPDPKQAKLASRYYRSQSPYYVEPVTGEIAFVPSGPLLTFKTFQEESRKIVFAPQGDAKITSVKIEQNKLIFQLKLEEKPEGRDNFFNRPVMMDACEAQVKTASGSYLIKSKSYDRSEHLFTFELDKANEIGLSELKISRIFLFKKTDAALDPALQARLEIGIFEALEVNVQGFTVKPNLVEPKVKWVRPSPKKKHKIEIALETNESVREISLQVQLKDDLYAILTGQQQDEIFYRKMTDTIQKPESLVDLSLDASQFSQRLEGQNLIIEFDLSSAYRFSTVEFIEKQITKMGIEMNSGQVNVAHSEMQIKTVSVLTNSLKSTNYVGAEPTTIQVAPLSQIELPARNYYERLLHGQINDTILIQSCRKLFE